MYDLMCIHANINEHCFVYGVCVCACYTYYWITQYRLCTRKGHIGLQANRDKKSWLCRLPFSEDSALR